MAEEFSNTLDLVKELEFSESEVFPVLFQYKMADTNQNLQTAQEVAAEHHEGKLDPKNAMMHEKIQKNMRKKGKIFVV